MSLREQRGEDGPGNTMADEPELAPVETQISSSSDGETVKGDRDEDYIADSLEEDNQFPETPVASAGPSIATYRSGELTEAENGAISEEGSTDAIPRRAASPLGSMLSVPDDTPSVQVR